MNSSGFDEDRDLQARFAELRRQDASQALEFARLTHRRGAERKPFPLRKLAVAVACIAIVALMVARLRPRPPLAPVPSLTEWKSPTDFLLQTPGRELLKTVPQFGAWPDGARVPGAPLSPTERKTI
jgi:hypothetical protein